MTAPVNIYCPRCGMGIHWDERAVVVVDQRWHADCASRASRASDEDGFDRYGDPEARYGL